jgi:hypothetical protein
VDLENDIESSTWSVILTFFNYQDNVSQHIPLKEDDINKLLGDEVVHVPELLILEGGIHQMLAGVSLSTSCTMNHSVISSVSSPILILTDIIIIDHIESSLCNS